MTGLMINQFAAPWVLALLPLPLLLLWLQQRRLAVPPTVLYSDLSVARGLPRSLRQTVLAMLPWTRALVLMLGIVALARPQLGTREFSVSSLGIDIAMVLDVSGSMQAQDLLPNRLEAAKAAAVQFVEGRKSDRVSVVVFGETAAVLCPPTLDLGAVQMFLRSIHDGMIRNNATAIGDGLALAVSKLKDSEAKSRVVVLLSDGENNAGRLEPMQAAEIARALGVRVYTISVGRPAGPPGSARAGFDTTDLRNIAQVTGGQYFHASNEEALRRVYAEIDQMERTEIETNETASYDERFMVFLLPALMLLGLELALRALFVGRLP
jgi:Ca-activated chloride channel family protein